MPIIEAKNLCRRFGRRWAYARINFQVEEGERLLVIGANGSGKTTLLRSLATLLQPTLGELRIFGLPVPQENMRLRKRIAMLSHQPGLYEDLSAVENVRVFAQMANMELSLEEISQKLDEVGLDDRKAPVRFFSAGMRKRAALAVMLLTSPSLILLDEPFAALDPQGMEALSLEIRRVKSTVIIASHQVERAAALCNRAILLENGFIRWRGEASQAWEAYRASQKELA